ncbi:MAG: phytoene dehydrogenase-like protein, partial [Myxococcota bacterium]
ELRRYLDYARGIWEAAAPAFVFGPAPGMGTLLGTDLRTLVGLRSIDAVSTMRGAIRRRVASQHLRAVLMRYATYNGSDARCAPATLNCIAHVELALGGYGVCGGMYALVRALEKLAESVGVRFRYSESVTTIQTARRRVQAVVTESGHHPADIVVSNADVAHLMCDLLGRRQGAAAESMSGWTAVFAASQRASSPGAARSAHTVLMPDRYDREFVDVFDGHTVPSTPALYACDQAVAHERAGWKDGRVPMFAMVNAPVARHVDDYDWAWLESQVRDRLTRADLIDAADPVVWRRTPRMLATRFPGTDGAIYGAASNSPLSAFRRPANRVKGVGGLYVASGSAHPGGGVPLCLLSGLAAARAVVRDVRGADEAARL